jgi:RNA polymerase sigma factor (TIGR02999 family)
MPAGESAASNLLRLTIDGDQSAADSLFALVYDELRGIASKWLNGDAARLTLQPTALVHEAYLKLIGAASLNWQSQTHFRAIAAKAMQQVMADHFRASGRAKRGGGWDRVTLTGLEDHEPKTSSELNGALEQLARVDQRAATVVILRFFGGLTEQDIARHLGVTERTIRNDWRMARAWLRANLEPEGGAE